MVPSHSSSDPSFPHTIKKLFQGRKKEKKMSIQTPFYSQGFNFESFLQKGVDPRTGQYSCSVDIYEAPAQTRNCPEFKLTLSYHALNTQDVGFGTGWSFNLSSYEHRQRKTLTLSTGENYQVTETASVFLVKEQKLKSFQARKIESGYEVVYKSGQTEILSNANNTYDRSVPIALYGSNGRSLRFIWERSGLQPRLSKIQDGNDDLLEIRYETSRVMITQNPGTPEASTFTLVQRDKQLVEIQLPLSETPPWEFTYTTLGPFTGLSRVKSPIGLIEEINYKRDGHRMPARAPYEAIPHVISHVVRPGRQQPLIRRTYSYSSRNFLGYNGGRDWSDTGDNLYQTGSEYQYTSTVEVEGGMKTMYEYNKFHLPVVTQQQQGTKKTTQTIEYYASPLTSFDNQPAQYQLPKTVTVSYADSQSQAERKEITEYVFDEWGNPTQEVKPNGVTTDRTYYPPEGEKLPGAGQVLCPADPHGFQRYLKTETLTPATTPYPTHTRRERFTYHELPTATDARAKTFVAVKDRVTHAGDQLLSSAEFAYVNQPGSRDHGRIQQETTWVSQNYATIESSVYQYPSSLEFKRVLTTTTFDGVIVKDETTFSLCSGLPVLQTDDDGVQDRFQYDKLGRMLKATTAPGTRYEATRQNEYSINEDGTGWLLSMTDAKGVQSRYITDGLERICQVEKQDDGGTFRLVQERSYNAQGQCTKTAEIDWLSMKGTLVDQRSSQELEYDNWGQVWRTSDSSGLITVVLTDPISLTRTEKVEGEGQTVTQLNVSRAPTQATLLRKDGTQYSKVEYRYDGLGRLVEKEDVLGRKTLYESDTFDRVTKTTWPGGRVVNVEYATQSAAKLPVAVQVHGITLAEQSLDGLDRVTERTVGERTTKQIYQSSMPQPAQITTQKGLKSNLAYEPGLSHAVTEVTGPGVEDAYSYDPQSGLPTHLKSSYSTRDLQYSPSGHLSHEKIQITQGADFSAQSTYSMAGKLLGYTDVHGQEYQAEYDAAGRMKSLSLKKMKVSFSYEKSGRLSQTEVQDEERNVSLTSSLSYDDFGREVERTVLQGTKKLYQLTQSYGETGLVAMRHLEDGDGKLLRDEVFGYDIHNHLVDYDCEGSQLPSLEQGRLRSQHFNFDEYDNLVEVTTRFEDGSENISRYSHSLADPTQLIRITNTHPDFTAQIDLEYDANGCLTQDEQGRTLEYDEANRLQAIRDGSGAVVSQYRYDAAGRLICQMIPEQPDTYLFYREDKLIAMKAGDRQVSYISDGSEYWGQSVQEGATTQTQLWASDGHQSVLTWLDAHQPGQIHHQQYTPHGHSAAGSSPSIGFNGQWRDPVTGWYHLGNGYRVYNPVMMRFLAPDSWSPFTTGEINPYAYCSGDPINRIDPSGHFGFFKKLFKKFSWKNLFTTLAGLAVSIGVGILTGGASLAIQIGVGIAAGVVAGVAAGALGDLADGRTPTWKSLAVDAVGGLVGGALGAVGGGLVSGSFKSAIQSQLGRAASYALVKESFKSVLKGAVKDAVVGTVIGEVAGLVIPIEKALYPSSGANETQSQSDSNDQLPDQSSGARDLGRPAPSAGEGASANMPTSSYGIDSGVGQSIPDLLNRELTCTFGPVGLPQGRTQSTGSGALEALEKRRNMYASMRSSIRRPQGSTGGNPMPSSGV
jgi:RHS repeat-associated protein